MFRVIPLRAHEAKLERTLPSNAVKTSLPPVDPNQAPQLQPEPHLQKMN
jgi:hypothetical protein